MKNFYFFIFSLLISFLSLPLHSQSNQNFDIKGTVTDTLDNPMLAATVLLLNKEDSTLVNFTRTELDGSFKINDVPVGEYTVKITYVAFLPKMVDASSLDGSDLDLGIIKIEEIAKELMEVVIKAAKAPMKMRGDTIEYDATTFQVPEGSSVEDLLKRLPGIEIEQDGNILSEGKSVDRVTVDGKKFFGADPKIATQNLPAESISKVQVFDTKSEEEEITGATGDSETKTMNLDLKDDFKKGAFGKVVAGAGTESTAELKGNYNKFNRKIQFSLVGVGNNTGRNGLSWDDYQDFMGSNAFSFGGGSVYGFGGSFRRFSFGGGEDDIESSIQSVFFQGSNNNGLPKNYNGGFNLNYDHNDLQANGVYFYNHSELERQTSSNQRSFFADFTTENSSESNNLRINRGHRAETSFEKEVDSLHTVIFNANLAAIDQDIFDDRETDLFRDGNLTTQSESENFTNTTGYLANAELILRKKFKKKGRSMGLNASYLFTELNEDGTQQSTINFLGGVDSTDFFNQTVDNIAHKNVFMANALYVEPLSNRIFFQSFYNFSNRLEDGDRDVVDQDKGLNEFLSRTYENLIRKNRWGNLLRYTYKGLNVSLGVAYQWFDLRGDFQSKGNDDLKGTVDETYVNWLPNFEFSLSPTRNSNIRLNYSRNAEEPAINDLQAIVDNSNPLFLRIGNPELVPSLTHQVSGRYRMNLPATAIRFTIGGSYNYFDNQFITETFIDENLVTTTRPINYSGGNRINGNTSFNFPIIRNKLSTSLRFNWDRSESFAFVNDILNQTNTTGIRPSFNLNITPSNYVSLYINGSLNVANTTYNISTSEDQQTKNYRLSAEFNAKTIFDVFVNSNFVYSKFENDRFNVDESVPVLNISIYRRFLPKNTLEARLSLYDGFNQNRGISQFASGNSVSESETIALGRYVMFSLSYNIRGMKNSVKKDRRWY